MERITAQHESTQYTIIGAGFIIALIIVISGLVVSL